jgi:hypothetical protein
MTNLKISRELVALLTLIFAVLAIGIYKRPTLALTAMVPVTHQDSIRELASMPDVAQARDSTVPVFVFRVVSGFTEPDEAGSKEYQVKEVILENRSTKDVSAVTLRWKLTPLADRNTVLYMGRHETHVLSSLRKTLFIGHRQTLKLSLPKIADLIKEIPSGNELKAPDGFALIIGVGEVVFADGSTWKEEAAASSGRRPKR